MRNLALLCAGLAIVSGIVSVRLWQELRAERQLTADLRAQLGRQPVVALRPPDAASAVRMTGEAQAAGAVAPPADSPAAASPAVPPPPQVQRAVRLDSSQLMNDPEYRAAMKAQLRSRMWQMHPGVAEALGLAQAETEKLFDVLAELEMERSAMPQVFGPDGQLDQAAMDEMRRRQQEFQQRQEEALASLLGPDGPQRYREYENTRGARMEAANLGQTLQAKNTPLTEVQSRALTDIFVAEAQRQRDEAQAMQRQLQAGANSPEDVARMRQASLDLQAERNRRILDAARGHLTAQQLEVLQSEFDHQLAMNRAATRLLMQQGGGQAGFVAIQAGGVTNVAVAAGP